MIHTLERFLRCAAMLEADAATGYDQLARKMEAIGNEEVAALFSKFGEFSRLHHREVRETQERELGKVFEDQLDDIIWPDAWSPENPLAHTELDGVTPKKAIETALETERRACDFYATIAGQTRSERVQELAQEFAEEEGEHVEHLERWLERL